MPASRDLPPDLPSDLHAALDRLATGVSRKDLAARAAAQSQNYRAGGGSRDIRSRDDALAYADRNGIAYDLELPQARRVRPKAYADNFRYGRIDNWTH